MTDERYKAVVGLTLADGKRIKPGAPVLDPADWLIEQGKVRLVKKRKKKVTPDA